MSGEDDCESAPSTKMVKMLEGGGVNAVVVDVGVGDGDGDSGDDDNSGCY